MSGFVAVAVADNDQVNVNDIRRLGAFVASAFGRNQPGIATTGLPKSAKTHTPVLFHASYSVPLSAAAQRVHAMNS